MLEYVASEIKRIQEKYHLQTTVRMNLDRKGLWLESVKFLKEEGKDKTEDDISYGMYSTVKELSKRIKTSLSNYTFRIVELKVKQEKEDKNDLLNKVWNKTGKTDKKECITWEDLQIGEEEKHIIEETFQMESYVILELGSNGETNNLRLDKNSRQYFTDTFFTTLPNVVQALNKVLKTFGEDNELPLNNLVKEKLKAEETVKTIQKDYKEIKESIRRVELGYFGGLLEYRVIQPNGFEVYLTTGTKGYEEFSTAGNREGLPDIKTGQLRVYAYGVNLVWNSVKGEYHQLNLATDYFFEDFGIVKVATAGNTGVQKAVRKIKEGNEYETYAKLCQMYHYYLGKDVGKMVRDVPTQLNLETNKPVKVNTDYLGYAVVDEQGKQFMSVLYDNHTEPRERIIETEIQLLEGSKKLWEALHEE